MTRITKTTTLSMVLALGISIWAMERPASDHENECYVLRIQEMLI